MQKRKGDMIEITLVRGLGTHLAIFTEGFQLSLTTNVFPRK